ncbi:ferric reductase NAD binding domain-containing protein [Crepidotus variabilis]|uniref:ferric-chelate reductase (NADPH) n=1 Tax=Crepidotus variabilis TaxID=179855 RepID=A0A9P6EFQ6_9AGAR|nr:ferric reductase NAD binding domain-containing protein [Crepidotus variabilis]
MPNAFTKVAVAKPNPDKVLRVARTLVYPQHLIWLIVGCIALLSIVNFASLAWRHFSRGRRYSSSTRHAISVTRIHLAAADTLQALAFRWTLPIGNSFSINFFEFAVCVAYVAALLSWSFADTTSLGGVKFDAHYYSNRAGRIAASQLPILGAFGMRNNIIALLTGIGFDKINLLHRTAARAICLLVWIHAGGRLALGLSGDDVMAENPWVQCGVLAGSSLTLLCFLTVRPIRNWNYEFFIVIHFIFVFIMLIALYFHTRARFITYWGIWPTMVIWGTDRFISLLRITLLNFSYLNPFSSKESKRALDASIEVLSPLFLRVSFKRPAYFRWRPGQSAFICFPTISALPWESHPFTISSLPKATLDGSNEIVFLLRVHRGLTARLLKEAKVEKTYPVFINGPYSNPPVLGGYNTVMLIAGGSGISFALPLFEYLTSMPQSSKDRPQRVVLIWAIRDADHAQWLAPAIRNIPGDLSVSVKIFVTSDKTAVSAENSADVSLSDEKTEEPGLHDRPLVSVDYGRPSITAIVKNEVEKSRGRMCVNVCGPSGLIEATRVAVRKPRPMDILRGGPTITLHVEGFGG